MAGGAAGELRRGVGGGVGNEGLVDSLVRLMGVQGVVVPEHGLGGLLATYMPGNAVDLAGWNKQMLDVLDPDVGDQLTRVIGFRLQVFDVRDDGSVLAHAIVGRAEKILYLERKGDEFGPLHHAAAVIGDDRRLDESVASETLTGAAGQWRRMVDGGFEADDRWRAGLPVELRRGVGGGERNEGLVDSLVRLMGEHGLAVPVQGLGGLLATYMPGNAVDLAGWNKQMLDVLDPDVGDQLTRVIGFRLQVFDVRDDGSVLAHAIVGRAEKILYLERKGNEFGPLHDAAAVIGDDRRLDESVASETLTGWLAESDWTRSQSYLSEHAEVLLDEVSVRMLSAMSIQDAGLWRHEALLDLALAGRNERFGYALLAAKDADSWRAELIAGCGRFPTRCFR